jgi:hypothetical protein
VLDALGRGLAVKALVLLDKQAQVLHAPLGWERGQDGLGLAQAAFDQPLQRVVHRRPLYGTSGLLR